MITELTREDLLLDLILRKELVRDNKGRGNLGCSDCEMVEFRTLGRGSRRKVITALDTREQTSAFKGTCLEEFLGR